jgi:hypothetical protein
MDLAITMLPSSRTSRTGEEAAAATVLLRPRVIVSFDARRDPARMVRARLKVALRAAEVRPARYEMGSTPSREDVAGSESGARMNMTVPLVCEAMQPREPV